MQSPAGEGAGGAWKCGGYAGAEWRCSPASPTPPCVEVSHAKPSCPPRTPDLIPAGAPRGPSRPRGRPLPPAPSHAHAGRGSSWRGGILARPLGRAVLVCCGLSLLPGAPPGPQKARGGGGGKADPQPGTPVLPGPWSRRSAFTSREEQPAPSGTSRLSLGPGLAERRGVTSRKRSVTSRGWTRDVAPAGKELPAERCPRHRETERAWRGGERRKRKAGGDRVRSVVATRVVVATRNAKNRADLGLCHRSAPAPQSAEREDALKST